MSPLKGNGAASELQTNVLEVTTNPPNTRHIRLLVDRPVEQFLMRLFLRDGEIRSPCIVSPFISSLDRCRFTLTDLQRKVERERISTYVIIRHQHSRDRIGILRKGGFLAHRSSKEKRR